MLSVDELIDDVIRREGTTYVNHPQDRGGPTKFGITRRALSTWRKRQVSDAAVKDLTRAEARAIYRHEYYLRPKIDRLPECLQPFVFDSAVNHGARRGIQFLQEACNQIGAAAELREDGVIGFKTIVAAELTEREVGCDAVIAAMVVARSQFYHDIVARDETQRVFLAGWMNRIAEWSPEKPTRTVA